MSSSLRCWIGLSCAITSAFGCLAKEELVDDFEPMCAVDADCDTPGGEICDQGICWGGPPAGVRFAAVLVPPVERSDLVRTEIPELAIAPNGTLSELQLAESVTVSGRVVLACDEPAMESVCNQARSIAAKIQISRRSKILGGPAHTWDVTAESGALDGEIGFSIRLPKSGDADAPYEVTVTPDDGNLTNLPATELPPAALAPPLRFTLSAKTDLDNETWVMGQPSQHKLVKGRVVDAALRGLPRMQIVALRADTVAGATAVSSLGVTDADGYYQLHIPLGVGEFFELVVKPEPGMFAPSLKQRLVPIPDPPADLGTSAPISIPDLRLPSFPTPTRFLVPARGLESGGARAPVVGAEVRFETLLYEDPTTSVKFSASGFTNLDGNAELHLIPGSVAQNRIYRVIVVPPPESLHASIYDLSVTVGTTNQSNAGVLPDLQLPRRVGLTGTLVAADGRPVSGATVTATPSLEFRWSLDYRTQAEVANLRVTSATADNDGKFFLWLEPSLAGQTGFYDLELEPPAGSGAPRWSYDKVQTGVREQVNLGEIRFPPASWARGTIETHDRELISGAKLRLFQIVDDSSICEGANLPPESGECVPPARLRGLWTSDESGLVRVVLPDPA